MSISHTTTYESAFVDHMVANELSFSGDEFVQRMDVYIENDKYITEHNSGNSTYTLGHNAFSHMTFEEFRAERISSPMPIKEAREVNDFADAVTADSIDWSTKGAVTPVKDQGSCGSCWAFSTTGGLEGAYQIKNGNLNSFSEQMLVDCDTVDSGCNGGLMDNAFDWISTNGGICSESDYAYTGTDGTCQSTCSTVSGTVPTHTDVASTEAALQAAVTQQPVSVAIEADQTAFQFYSSGVLTGRCGTNLDHGVLAVGYGTDGTTDYWKVKNSWGASWGMDGYINIERGNSQSGGECGILMAASYPSL